MSAEIQLAQLAADDALLDRLGAARADGAMEPVTALLAAVARHADSPLRPGPVVRPFRSRRALTALTVLVVGASGAGVAAAMNRSDGWSPPLTHRAAVEQDQHATGARDDATAPGAAGAQRVEGAQDGAGAHDANHTAPTRQGTSQMLAGPTADGYALVRDTAGRIVLLPQHVLVAADRQHTASPEAGPLLAGGPAAERLSATAGAGETPELHMSLLLAPHPEAEIKPGAGQDAKRPDSREADVPTSASSPATPAAVPAPLAAQGATAQDRSQPTPPVPDPGASAPDKPPADTPQPPHQLPGSPPVGRSSADAAVDEGEPSEIPPTPVPSTGPGDSTNDSTGAHVPSGSPALSGADVATGMPGQTSAESGVGVDETSGRVPDVTRRPHGTQGVEPAAPGRMLAGPPVTASAVVSVATTSPAPPESPATEGPASRDAADPGPAQAGR